MFSLTSSNVTQPHGHDAAGRRKRRTTPSAIIVGAATVALLASANTFAHAAESSSRIAQEHYACAVAWASINRETSTTRASGASIRRYLSLIKRGWLRETETRAPRKGLSPVRRPTQSAW